MSVQQLISYLGECRRRLSDLQGRAGYLPLHCSMFRLEGQGGILDDPFSSVLVNRVYWPRMTVSTLDNPFWVAFYPARSGATPGQIDAALGALEAITGEGQLLLAELPKAVQEYHVLPQVKNCWRTVFHLAWHFPRVFLKGNRERLLTTDGSIYTRVGETMVQMWGTSNREDLVPGLIYSTLEHDVCTCSEAAIGVIIDALERHAQTELSAPPEAQTVSAEQRRTFGRLRAEFLAGTQMPAPSLECKLLKLADSFNAPPANEWAGLEMGGVCRAIPDAFTAERHAGDRPDSRPGNAMVL